MHFLKEYTLEGEGLKVDELVEVLEGLGLKPELHEEPYPLRPYTLSEVAYGRITFDTCLGGRIREQKGLIASQSGAATVYIDDFGVEKSAAKLVKQIQRKLSQKEARDE